MNVFNSIDGATSFVWAWAIGYEIVAAVILFFIFKSALAYSRNSLNGGHIKSFQRP